MMDLFSLSILQRPLDLGLALASLSLLGYLSVRSLRQKEDTTNTSLLHPLPPGPPTDPLIGSARYFPTTQLWKGFCDWQKSYGDLVYAKLPGTSFVMINSHDVCQEILGKRTNTTSGRDAGYMFTNVMKLGWILTMLQPGGHHANQRRMIRKAIGPSAIAGHDAHFEKITNEFMTQLSTFKGEVPPQVMTIFSRIIIEITYGKEIWKSAGEELAARNRETIHLAELGLFNFWPVDFLHFLRFIPSWVPGAYFKQIGERAAELSDYVRYRPFEMARELHSRGQLSHCVASELLDEFGPDDDVRDGLGILYMAGSDTTSGAINSFIYDMYLFPHIAQKVYDEIRTVTQGGQRMLEISDRRHLPYTEAVWKEALRWNPFFTLGVPHVNTQEEIVKGVRIPKGSVIAQNIGFMLTDPTVWGDPEVFRPERFLEEKSGGSNTELPSPNIVFGFGARACPGLHLADRAGFHIAATTVSLFEVLPLEGNPGPSGKGEEARYTDMPLRAPKDFYARFKPRDQQAEYLLSTLTLDQE